MKKKVVNKKRVANIVIKCDTPKEENLSEIIMPAEKDEEFVTSDGKLVEKLQKNFTVREVQIDRTYGIRTFRFNATKKEIEKYLEEGK